MYFPKCINTLFAFVILYNSFSPFFKLWQSWSIDWVDLTEPTDIGLLLLNFNWTFLTRFDVSYYETKMCWFFKIFWFTDWAGQLGKQLKLISHLRILSVIIKVVWIINGFYSNPHKDATVLPVDYITHPEHIKANMYFTVCLNEGNKWKNTTRKDIKCSPELNLDPAVTAQCCHWCRQGLSGGNDPPPPVTYQTLVLYLTSYN